MSSLRPKNFRHHRGDTAAGTSFDRNIRHCNQVSTIFRCFLRNRCTLFTDTTHELSTNLSSAMQYDVYPCSAPNSFMRCSFSRLLQKCSLLPTWPTCRRVTSWRYVECGWNVFAHASCRLCGSDLCSVSGASVREIPKLQISILSRSQTTRSTGPE